MAMVGDDGQFENGELALVTQRHNAKHQQQQGEFNPWSMLLPQLQKCASQLQGHLQRHVQARMQRMDGAWRVGGWGRRGEDRKFQQTQRISLRGGRFAAIIPGDSVAETVITSGIFSFLNIYNTLLVARLILTWFPNPPEIIANPLSTLCDPYLNIFRGIIPPLGQIDLSPVLAFLALNFFTSTAAALPAELPSNRAIAQCSSRDSHLTWRQRAQMKKGQKPVKTEEKPNE